MIDISLFGPTAVRPRGGSGPDVQLPGVKPRQIVELLACEVGRPVTKDLLAECLWDGAPPSSYAASLESYVSVLRRTLNRAGADAAERRARSSQAVVTTRGGYLLDPELVTVDLHDVSVRLGALCRESGWSLVTGAEDVLRALQGPLLADEPYADWAGDARSRFGRLLEGVLTRAADAAVQLNESARAVRLARVAVDANRLSEPACRALMSACRSGGSRPEAIMAYSELRAVLGDELGIEPSAETRSLYLDLLEAESRPTPAGQDRLEMRTLAQLLHQALESGVRPDSSTRSWLMQVGDLVCRQPA